MPAAAAWAELGVRTLIGVDLSPGRLLEARSTTAASTPMGPKFGKVRLVCADVTARTPLDVGIPIKSVDVALMWLTAEELAKDTSSVARAMDFACRCLREGGVLAMAWRGSDGLVPAYQLSRGHLETSLGSVRALDARRFTMSADEEGPFYLLSQEQVGEAAEECALECVSSGVSLPEHLREGSRLAPATRLLCQITSWALFQAPTRTVYPAPVAEPAVPVAVASGVAPMSGTGGSGV